MRKTAKYKAHETARSEIGMKEMIAPVGEVRLTHAEAGEARNGFIRSGAAKPVTRSAMTVALRVPLGLVGGRIVRWSEVLI